MRISRMMLTGLMAGLMMFAAGCSWFDNKEDIDPRATGSVPYPGTEALGGVDGLSPSGFRSGGGEGFGMNDPFGERIPGVNFAPVYFPYDQDQISASERGKVERVAEFLNSHAGTGVIVEGHCDERGSAEYNRALGERRALSVKQYLGGLGIPENRIKTISYGEERPAVQGSNEDSYAKNRRAEFIAVKMR